MGWVRTTYSVPSSRASLDCVPSPKTFSVGTERYRQGFCAESRFAPSATRALNRGRDFDRARESLGEKSHWIFLLSAVDEVIGSQWPMVERLATALLKRGTLSETEIARLGDF